MNFVAGAKIGAGARQTREITLRAHDAEGLLVAFLNELVYAQEQEGLGFDEFDVRISDHELIARLSGSSLGSLVKPIKAVTYHNMKIRRTAFGLEVEIVFDV